MKKNDGFKSVFLKVTQINLNKKSPRIFIPWAFLMGPISRAELSLQGDICLQVGNAVVLQELLESLAFADDLQFAIRVHGLGGVAAAVVVAAHGGTRFTKRACHHSVDHLVHLVTVAGLNFP